MLTLEAATVLTAIVLGWADPPSHSQVVTRNGAPTEQYKGDDAVGMVDATGSVRVDALGWLQGPEGPPGGDFAALLTGLHAQGTEVPSGALAIEIE